MSKYVIEFTKTGTICYTSHLDLMRIFKRVFKRTDTPLAYSQGFNPHPKMGFAQPLSLGYWGMEEFFECETADEWEPDQLLQRLAQGMPEGIDLKRCLPAEHLTKTLAAHTVAAEYMIAVPLEEAANEENSEPQAEETSKPQAEEKAPEPGDAAVEQDPEADLNDPRSLWHSYMDLEEILVWKRQKKKKEPKLINIRSMIREVTFHLAEGVLYIDAVLDCGSDSNLSPELIISSVCRRFGIVTDRSEVSVMRKKIMFDQPLEKLLSKA